MNAAPPPIVTLATDFGGSDHYIGAMKGVILSVCPWAHVVDMAHDLRAHDVRSAAWVVAGAVETFPARAIHVIVIDPGVGGSRRALAVETSSGTFVAPDNGVLSFVLEHDPPLRTVELTNVDLHRHPVSPTFHGRDIFAPVAAHLANGADLSSVGSPGDEPMRLAAPRLDVWGGVVVGEVVHVDRFGNAVTNIPAAAVREACGGGCKPRFECGTFRADGVTSHFGAAPTEEAVVVVGSRNTIELCLNMASAADRHGLSVGDAVHVHGARRS